MRQKSELLRRGLFRQVMGHRKRRASGKTAKEQDGKKATHFDLQLNCGTLKLNNFNVDGWTEICT